MAPFLYTTNAIYLINKLLIVAVVTTDRTVKLNPCEKESVLNLIECALVV